MITLLCPTVAGIIYALEQSNAAGKIIVLLLFAGSILAWTVMLTKSRELRQAVRSSNRFISAYRAEATPLGLYLKRREFKGSPLAQVYERSCRALGAHLEARGNAPEDLFTGEMATGQLRLRDAQLRGVRTVAERTVADLVLEAESSMGLLATAVSTAPFLGLLGTVWGVMESFGAMAVTGTAMLSAVAPGISGALLTTVVGLLVALPSAIGYNLLSDRIKRLTVSMDNFAQEFVSDLDRHFLIQD